MNFVDKVNDGVSKENQKNITLDQSNNSNYLKEDSQNNLSDKGVSKQTPEPNQGILQSLKDKISNAIHKTSTLFFSNSEQKDEATILSGNNDEDNNTEILDKNDGKKLESSNEKEKFNFDQDIKEIIKNKGKENFSFDNPLRNLIHDFYDDSPTNNYSLENISYKSNLSLKLNFLDKEEIQNTTSISPNYNENDQVSDSPQHNALLNDSKDEENKIVKETSIFSHVPTNLGLLNDDINTMDSQILKETYGLGGQIYREDLKLGNNKIRLSTMEPL